MKRSWKKTRKEVLKSVFQEQYNLDFESFRLNRVWLNIEIRATEIFR